MIEIKFRVWDNNNNEMLTDKPGRGRVTEILLNYHMGLLKDNPFSFMQNTGLKDKNGVEIYESDKLRIIFCDDFSDDNISIEEGAIHEVEVYFMYGAWFFSTKDLDYLYAYSINEIADIEVIGNIYENKELL